MQKGFISYAMDIFQSANSRVFQGHIMEFII